MTKKIFAISTLLLVLVIGAIFVYNFAFKKQASEKSTATSEKASEEGKKSTADSKKDVSSSKSSGASVSAISDEMVFGATLSPDGNYIYLFSGGNGQLNQVDLTGKLDKVLSTERFMDIKKISWNKPKNKVVIETKAPSAQNSKFLYYDLANKSVTTLKDNVDSVSWSNLGDKIIYKYYNPKTKKRTLSVSDPDGKNWRDLSEFNYFGVKIAPVPGSSEISFWPNPNAFTSTSANLISFSGENKKEILKDKYGVDILWSPDGKKAAVSFSDQKGGHKTDLALMNTQGGEFQSLGFPTFVSKCTWSADSKFIFCAMPGNIPESAILPNDWQEGKVTTADTFWKIDTESGKKERLVDPEKIEDSCDVLNPFLSKDEKMLFFVSKSDGKLYRLDLSGN